LYNQSETSLGWVKLLPFTSSIIDMHAASPQLERGSHKLINKKQIKRSFF